MYLPKLAENIVVWGISIIIQLMKANTCLSDRVLLGFVGTLTRCGEFAWGRTIRPGEVGVQIFCL